MDAKPSRPTVELLNYWPKTYTNGLQGIETHILSAKIPPPSQKTLQLNANKLETTMCNSTCEKESILSATISVTGNQVSHLCWDNF